MCYTGECPYEHGSGDGAGECKLNDNEPIPEDAYCVLMDERIDEYERKHPISTMYRRVKQDAMLLRGHNEILF